MATTISVSESTRRRLMELKLREGKRSLDEVLEQLLIDHNVVKLREAQTLFQRLITERNLTVEDIVGKDLLE